MSKSVTGCCPPFDPAEWDGKTFKFVDKPFMKFSVRSFMHIPLGMGSAMRKAMAQVEDAGASTNEYFMLSDDVSPWYSEHYLATSKDVPGAEMVKLSGSYMAKVFEGPYKDMGKWYRQLIDFTKSKGRKPVKTYFSYTMCPACAKAYGKNYVVGFEQVE